jgi:hypothetical protein
MPGPWDKYAAQKPVTMAVSNPQGMLAPGNIDLSKRPIVRNADGSYSTVRSISIDQDGKSYLIPTVVNGRVVSDEEATKHFQQTGEHLGVFDNWKDADAYGETLHNQQATEYDTKASQQGPWSKYGSAQAAPDQVLPDITVHPDDTNDVVSGMSGFQRGMAGTGASIMSQIRGLGQAGLELANQALAPSRVVTQVEGRQNIPSDYVQKKLGESKQAETEARQINAPLLATPEGFVGNLAGYAIPLAAGGAGLRGTLAARAFLPENIGGMTAQGAAMGATQPLATGEGGMDRLKNAAIGGAAGFAGAAAPRVVGAALRGTKAALEPFTKAGQEAIAARALQEGAINPASLTQSAPSAIPGVS